MAIFNDKNGYNVYMGGLLLPITPSEITISNGSNNKTITLINEGDVNILKSPALTEISLKHGSQCVIIRIVRRLQIQQLSA